MTVKLIVLCFSLIIYLLILAAFNKARARYAGGKIGDVINLILITVILFFIADYVRLLEGYLSENTLFIFQSLFRAAALAVLAFGGARIAAE
ncbi:MAG: hypothetical protein JXD19_04635 [Deltaproteobacteria bacterium]|nr:hypothetical protein [Deltaproteobacteria bacterium]